MSAAPSLPPDYREPQPPLEPPRKRRTWARVLGWIGAGILALVVLVIVAVVVLLHSARFHSWVLAKAQQQATAALGTTVQVRDFSLHLSLSAPTLDLYTVTIYGAQPHPTPPLLQADHIGAGVTIVSLFRRQWYVNNLRIDHPVARVFVDRNGADNLPKTQSSSKSNTSIFDLGIRHAVLDRGEVYYNNRKSVLNADLHDVEFRSGFNPSHREYAGTLSYRDGHLQMGTYRPLPHNLDARFTASPTKFTLQRAVLSSGPSQFVLDARIDNYSQPHLTARYDAVLDTAQFRRILNNPSLPAGVIRLAGSVNYQSEPNRPMLETTTLKGELSSRALQVQTPSFRGAITNIGARYALANGNGEVRDLRANVLGGEVTGTLTMRNITGASQSRLRASVRGISLADLKKMMSSPALQRVGLTGSVDADADAAWGKTMSNLVAHTDATIQARAAANTPGVTTTGPVPTVPLTGAIHADYAAARKQIALTNSFVRLPQTSLTLNGSVSTRSALQVRLVSTNLHELENIADMFQTPAPGRPPQPLNLYGTASFIGAVRGTTTAPDVTGVLSAANLRVKGSAIRLLRTNVNLNPSMASLQDGLLQAAGRGQVNFSVNVGLHRWSFTSTSPMQVRMNASQVNIADLTKAAGVQTPVTGTLNANIAAHGSELNPMGQGTIRLTNANVSGQPINAVSVNFQGTGDVLHANLAVQLPAAGGANATLTYFPKQLGYQAQLRAIGIRLGQLAAVKQRNLDLTGTLNLTASGSGTLKNPGVQASVQVPRLNIKGQTISGISLQANVANQVANVALDSQVISTYVRGRGTVHLTGDYETIASLDTQAIPLQPLVAAYSPSLGPNLTGQTELHVSIRGPVKNMAALQAHVTIPTLAVSYKNTVHIGAANPIHLDYVNGVLALQRAAIRGTGTDLELQGSIPVKNTSAPLSLLMLGTIDLSVAQLFNPDISSSGQIRFDINSFGARADPNVQGQIRIVNATVASGTVPLGLSNANGVLTLTKDRLNITQFQGNVGGGTLAARGGVVYKPGLKFDLGIQGRHIRFLYPQGVRAAVDTDLSLSGATEASQLTGQVRLDQLQFTPDFDLTNLASQTSGETTPPPSGGMTQNMKLDVAIQSAGGINAVSRTMSLQAAMNLRLQGTADQPVVTGRINVNGGDLIFMGNRYELQGGTIDFVNPSRTEPIVNMAVNTTIQQYNIHMRFEGPVEQLRTNYSSDPSLPPSDIINLLAFGKTSEASAAQAAANPTPGSLAAESAIASQVSSQVTSRLQKIAGISQLSVDPVLNSGQSSGQNPGARITIQQRVTSNLFVTFATDVTSTQRDVIQVQYSFSPRITFSGTRDQNGGFGFDTRIRKTW